MRFPSAHIAYSTGFRDDYNGVMNRAVPNFNREHEWGFISGAMQRKRLSNLPYETFLMANAK